MSGRLEILKLWVDPVDLDQALASVRQFVQNGRRPHSIFAVNPEKNYSVPQDPDLWEIFRTADLLIPDGIGVVLAARILYGVELNRVPGVRLMHGICALAAREGYRVYVYGAKEEVNEKAVNQLRDLYPGLNIVGRDNGYLKPEDMPELVKRINSSMAQILFLALGSPKQEKWYARYGRGLETVRVCQGIGGTLDTVAGNVKLAPETWQNLGLEWLYRLLKEPSRLRRQMVLPLFALQVMGKKAKSMIGLNRRADR
ncbi:MAG: WecB/TagA/CpsF family glycosyltransferase [Thermodesulfobacteriota bacterium]